MSKPDLTRLLLLHKYGSPSQQANATTALKALEQTEVKKDQAVHKALLDKSSQPLEHGTAYESMFALLEDVALKCSGLPKKTQGQIAAILVEQRIMGA